MTMDAEVAREERTPIWLDCDPGHDDAFAIILAAEHPQLDLLGISTVHGNASIDRVTYNALSILTAISRTSINVYPGSRKPYMRAAVHAPAIHGASGIDGTLLLPEPAHSFNPQNAIAAMYGAIMATAPQTCVLVATGTLTNVALLLSAFPDVAAHLKAVSIMGGAFGNPGGNITAHAEFNIFCDPESAQAVFSHPQLAGGRIFLVPLDATHTVLATEIVQNRLLVGGGGIDRIGGDVCETTGKGNEFRRMLYELLTYFAATYAKVFDITEGPPLHDPLAVAAALTGKHAVGFEWEEGIVKVVCDGVEAGKTLLTRGEDTYVRRASLGGEDGPYMGTVVMVAKKVDSNAFWKVMLEMVDKADGRFVWPKDFLKTD